MVNAQRGTFSDSISELFEAFEAAFAILEREPVVSTNLCSGLGLQSSGPELNHFLQKFGIRSFLSMRAQRLLGSTQLSSPVLPLVDVLTLRKQLLLARSQGWQSFRNACFGLLSSQDSDSSQSGCVPPPDSFNAEARTSQWDRRRKRRLTEALYKPREKFTATLQRRPKVVASTTADIAFERLQIASSATERALAACKGKGGLGIRRRSWARPKLREASWLR